MTAREPDELHDAPLPPAWPASEPPKGVVLLDRKFWLVGGVGIILLLLCVLYALISSTRALSQERSRSKALEEQVAEQGAQLTCRGEYAANVDAAGAYELAAIGAVVVTGYEQAQARQRGDQAAVDAAAAKIATAVGDTGTQSQGLLQTTTERLESVERCAAGVRAVPYPKPERLAG